MKESDNKAENTISEHCKNCGTELKGSFCHNCGQEQKDIHKSFRRLFHDFLGDSFAFDSRLFRTLKTLLLKPGHITTEVLKGQRIRFIPPVKLYLFISFIYFMLLSVTGPFGNNIKINENGKNGEVKSGIVSFGNTENSPEKQKEQADMRAMAMKKLETDKGWLNENVIEPFVEKMEKIAENEERFGDILVRNFPKAMFLLLPFFALLLKLLFRKKGFFYIEHLIFSLHFHSFGFITYILVELATLVSGSATSLFTEIIDSITSIWLIIYLFKALRHVYGTSFKGTLARYCVLLFLYFFGFIFSFITILIISLLMF